MDNDGRDEEETPDNATTKTGKCPVAVQHDHDADSNSFHEVPNEEPEDELEPWVDCMRAPHKAEDLLAANGITSWILRQSRIHWKLTPTGIQRHQPSRKGTRGKEDRPRDGETTSTHTYKQPESHERHDLVHHVTRWSDMGLCVKRLCEQETQASNTTHDPITTTTATQPTTRTHDVHDQSPRPRRRRRQRRPRKRRRRQATYHLPNNPQQESTTANRRATTATSVFTTHSFWVARDLSRTVSGILGQVRVRYAENTLKEREKLMAEIADLQLDN